jgi:hypothetical protein
VSLQFAAAHRIDDRSAAYASRLGGLLKGQGNGFEKISREGQLSEGKTEIDQSADGIRQRRLVRLLSCPGLDGLPLFR